MLFRSNPVLDEDGALDKEKYSQHITEAIKTETEYIVTITGQGDGKIKGMGSSGSPDGKAALKESFKRGYLREGKPEEEAERLASLAVNVR